MSPQKEISDISLLRKANINDVISIVYLWKLFYEESFYQICKIPFDNYSTVETVTNMVNNPSFIALVAEIEEEIVGVIIGTILPFSWNKNYFLSIEAIWYVKKEYRGNSIGIRLLEEYENISRSKGATHIEMGHMEYLDDQTRKPILDSKRWITTGEYYKKKGFKIMEQHYIKEIGGSNG